MLLYNQPALALTYAEATRQLDTSRLRSSFLVHVRHLHDAPPHLLDLGCGSGRDALAFRQLGYRVDAVDASAAMADLAREYAFCLPKTRLPPPMTAPAVPVRESLRCIRAVLD